MTRRNKHIDTRKIGEKGTKKKSSKTKGCFKKKRFDPVAICGFTKRECVSSSPHLTNHDS